MDLSSDPYAGTRHARAQQSVDVIGGPSEAESSDDGFGDIGLPTEAGWYVSASLYWIAGLTIVMLDQLAPEGTIDPLIAVLGALALAASPLLLLGARFAPTASWGAPVRLIFPVIFFSVGAFAAGEAIVALGYLYLFPLLAVAYMHRTAISIPFCSFSIVAMDVAFIAYDSTATGVARAVVFTGVVVSLVSGLIIAQSRLRRAAAENHRRAITDPLTGLTNLRGLRSHLDQEIQRATRDESEIVLFAIDLDDFKLVNDRFGYALGDGVLRAVATAISEEIEPGDLVARRGGDEFAIVAIATPGRHMSRFADRIAAAIERTRRSTCPGVNPRASITRATHRPGESAAEFMLRVDDGLHDAKIDAHPERSILLSDDAQGETEIDGDRQIARMLEGAKRAQVGIRAAAHIPDQAERAQSWRLAAWTAGISAVLIATLALPGLLPEVRNPVTLIGVIGLILVASASIAVANLPISRNWIHIPLVSILGLIIAVVLAAGDSGYVLAELCILPVPLAVVVLGWRPALPYLLVACSFYASFMLGSDASYATLQAIILVGVTIVLAFLLARGTELAEEFYASALSISMVDPLTGAANLIGFNTRVEQEIARAEATGGEVCLMMIDLEQFKAVNDTYTHSIGDALLVETTQAIVSVVRDDELVVRRGGDEFVVVCAPTLEHDMNAMAMRIRDAIVAVRKRATPEIPAGATVLPVFRESGESGAQLMERADEALRLAKLGERSAHRHAASAIR